jgi:hypothetical protein
MDGYGSSVQKISKFSGLCNWWAETPPPGWESQGTLCGTSKGLGTFTGDPHGPRALECDLEEEV